jgi:hypothetical protein
MKEDQSKYYIVKSNETGTLEWEKIKSMYVVAQKTYFNTINQKPRPGEDPMMIKQMAERQFTMDCENIQKMYYDRWQNGYLPTPVTINGKQKNVVNGEDYILIKDPTPNFQDSFIDETGYDLSTDRAIYEMSYKVPLQNFKTASLSVQNWSN